MFQHARRGQGFAISLILASVCVVGEYVPLEYLPFQQCYSTFALTATNTRIGGLPTEPRTVFTSTLLSTKLQIDCLQIIANGSASMTASQEAVCQRFPFTIEVCQTSADGETRFCNRSLELRTRDVVSGLLLQTVEPYSVSLTYFPNTSMPIHCYPRFLTTLVVLRDVVPTSKSSVAAVVVFVLIAAIVLVVLVVFGQYQIRKVFAKFDKKVSAKPRGDINLSTPPPRHQLYDEDGDGGAYAEGDESRAFPDSEDISDEEFFAMYGHHAIRPRGMQKAELVDGVVVTAKPLVQPWYQRVSYHQPPPMQPSQPLGLSAPKPLQVAHINPPVADDIYLQSSGVRRRQASPPQPFPQQQAAPHAYSQSGPHNTSQLVHSPAAGPRKLQFPSPVHVQSFPAGGSPPPRVVNPYEESSF